MWIDYEEELINLNKVTTIRKSVGTALNILLIDAGKEIKKIPFKNIEDLEDYYDFLKGILVKKNKLHKKNERF